MSNLSAESFLIKRPWAKTALLVVDSSKGMLRSIEGNMLHFLARDYYMGVGEIVDAGAFLGLSARMLASGLKCNLQVKNKKNRVHCFDKFRADEKFIFDYITKNAKENITFGSSFRHLFEKNLGDLLYFVDVSEGDFLSKTWRGLPIEILFIDICKNIPLNSHVVGDMFPFLIPDRSILVQQDYHHPHLPHIHVTMAYLSDYFKIIDEKADDSIAYLCLDEIPGDKLEKVVNFDFSESEQISLMDKAIDLLSPVNRYHVELAKVRLLINHNELSSANLLFNRLVSDVDQNITDVHWDLYSNQVKILLPDCCDSS